MKGCKYIHYELDDEAPAAGQQAPVTSNLLLNAVQQGPSICTSHAVLPTQAACENVACFLLILKVVHNCMHGELEYTDVIKSAIVVVL